MAWAENVLSEVCALRKRLPDVPLAEVAVARRELDILLSDSRLKRAEDNRVDMTLLAFVLKHACVYR